MYTQRDQRSLGLFFFLKDYCKFRFSFGPGEKILEQSPQISILPPGDWAGDLVESNET